MKLNDWQRTEEIFHAAVGLTAEERAVYLAEACSGDASLRREVESLITAFENGQELLERPAFSLGMRMLSREPEESLVGRQIGPYKIEALLGRGGMGKVYLAQDDLLDRKVALKFLSHSFTDDAWAKRQLMKEAQAVARLDHPNICAVHGFEEHQGYSFIVMQYVEGETLASLISNGALEAEQVPPLAAQIVSALVEAHSHGIVHRDIKPQNIMVTAGGQVKVLDFGLAKVLRKKQDALGLAESESQSSQLGLLKGTVAYMSPEQLRGDRLDFRSDIFSFGIVLYEMISGNNPYSRASNAETISAILTSDPPPPTPIADSIPIKLARVAQKCMSKDREPRYQSASELLMDMDRPMQEVEPRPIWHRLSALRVLVLVGLNLLLVFAIALLYLPDRTARTVAVLPIVNKGVGATTESFGEGLAEGLARRLSRLPELRVKTPTIVPAYTDQKTFAQLVGRGLNADALFLGEIKPQGDSIALHVTLVEVADGSSIWQEVYSVKPEELLRLQNELAYRIASNLQPSLSEDEKNLLADKLLTTRQTDSPEAYRLYLLGWHALRKRDRETVPQAINYFNKAIELDPLFAQAHAGLADCYVLLNSVAYGSMPTAEAMSRAKAAVKDALQIDDTLCEAHTSFGVIRMKYDWNWLEAERDFKRAISLDPDYPLAHFWYSQLLALMRRPAEAIKESEIAKALDPFSPLAEMNLGRVLYLTGQYEKALKHFDKMLESNPDSVNVHYMLGLLYNQKGLLEASIRSFEQVYSLRPDLGVGPLGFAYARAGRREDAYKMLNKLEEIEKQRYISDQEKALIYMGLEDKETAFIYFDKACKERSAPLPFIKVDPLFDSIRSDSRYAILAQCANIAE